ncbi:MAG: iron-siderophore ABC transporter substrate-binding protein [Cyanobacteria bacterium P01_G01_bin.54]
MARPSRSFSRKRRFLLLAGVSSLVATACSGRAQTDTASTSRETSETGATQRVQHAYGETEIPAHPTRVAVVDFTTVEAVMSLGIEPIAAPGIIIDNLLHLPPATQEIVDIGIPGQPSLEKLATLKPDLILTTKMATQDNDYELLAQIAPTVACDIENWTQWQELAWLCAEALGKEAEAEQLAADYEAKLDQLKAALPKDPGDTEISVIFVNSNQISALAQDSFSGSVLAAAGFSRPPKQAVEQHTVQVTKELLGDVDGDALFVLKSQSQTELAADVRAAIAQVKQDPLWNQLEAVQADRVYEVDAYWYGVGYLAANLILDDLMNYVAA